PPRPKFPTGFNARLSVLPSLCHRAERVPPRSRSTFPDARGEFGEGVRGEDCTSLPVDHGDRGARGTVAAAAAEAIGAHAPASFCIRLRAVSEGARRVAPRAYSAAVRPAPPCPKRRSI